MIFSLEECGGLIALVEYRLLKDKHHPQGLLIFCLLAPSAMPGT